MSSSFLWRSFLYAPGNNPKLLERVYSAGADAVVLDLEDSVPEQEKPRARALVAQAVDRARDERAVPVTFVRVNGVESARCEDDIRAVVRLGLRGLRLPKVESTDAVMQAATWVDAAEWETRLVPGSICVDCSIETARGVHFAMAIASSSPRVRALVFGALDFALDIGVELTENSLECLYARSQIVIASRVATIRPPVDGVYPRLSDPEGLLASVRSARTLGFFGKSAVHPSQLGAIHAVFTPSPEEIDRAQRIVQAFEEAAASGRGAVRLDDGTFIDPPVADRARQTLALAKRFVQRELTEEGPQC